MRHGKSIENLYSPYRENQEETMDIWYERYLNDKNRYLNLNGYTYSKIVEKSEFQANPGFSLLIIFEPLENVQIGDTLMDEKGREL